jgi:hypothetical protein
MPSPMQLSDEEMDAVIAAARPVHPQQRDSFLCALAGELERRPSSDPAFVRRLAADLQRRYVVEARVAADSAAPRRLTRQAAR